MHGTRGQEEHQGGFGGSLPIFAGRPPTGGPQTARLHERALDERVRSSSISAGKYNPVSGVTRVRMKSFEAGFQVLPISWRSFPRIKGPQLRSIVYEALVPALATGPVEQRDVCAEGFLGLRCFCGCCSLVSRACLEHYGFSLIALCLAAPSQRKPLRLIMNRSALQPQAPRFQTLNPKP